MKRIFYVSALLIVLFPAIGVRVQAQQICWLEEAFGAALLRSANLDGSAQRTLALDLTSLPEGLTIDEAGNIYWTELQFAGARLHRAGPAFQSPTILVTDGSALRGIAVDQQKGKLYWASSNLLTGPAIFSCPISGGAVETLAVLGPRSNPRGIVVDTTADKLYWCEYEMGSVRSLQRQPGGVPTDLITGLDGPHGLALDVSTGTVYWTEFVGNRIRRINRNGSGLASVLEGLSRPGYIALDVNGGRIVWAELEPGRIRVAGMDGSNPMVVPVSVTIPGGVAFASSWTTVVRQDEIPPLEFFLAQNHPNPFNPSTTIRYTLPHAGPVRLEVFTPLGALITVLQDGPAEAGHHAVEFPGPGRTIASGTYFYRLSAGGHVSTRRMVHVK